MPARLAQAGGGLPDLLAPAHVVFEVANPGVGLCRTGGRRRITMQRHARARIGALGAGRERMHRVAPGRQRRGQVLELAREVLVNEQQVHAGVRSTGPPTQPESQASCAGRQTDCRS